MRKSFVWLIPLGIGLWGVLFLARLEVRAQTQFPIPELGNCESQDACRVYCEDAGHTTECLAYGKKQGLVDEKSAEAVEAAAERGGPGGCRDEQACRQYCAADEHATECLAFAETHGLLSADEIKRARAAITQKGPGGCRGAACKEYCADPAHRNECLEFGKRTGRISEQQYRLIKSIQEGGPGGCQDAQACRSYCKDDEHVDECAAFAEKNGLVSHEDAQRFKKIALRKGPGDCQGEDACHAYCEDEAHQKECIDFAEEHGFMNHEEAERGRKFTDREGPGGCRGDACRIFCENSDHAQVCLDYGEKEGLISSQEVARIRKFLKAVEGGGPGGCQGAMCREYCADPAHRDACLAFGKKQGLITDDEEKRFSAGEKIQKKVEESGGPGGCREENECRVYCTEPSHVEECVAFASAHGGVSQEDAQAMLKQFTDSKLEAGGEFRPPEDVDRFRKEVEQRFEQFRQLEEQFRGKGMETGGFGSMGSSMPGPGAPGNAMGDGMPSGISGRGFVGPGGCSGPAECIKYCTEHKDECFSFGSSGKPDTRPPEGGIPPGRAMFQLRTDIMVRPPEGADKNAFGRCVSAVASAEQSANPAEDKKAAFQKCAEQFKFNHAHPEDEGNPRSENRNQVEYGRPAGLGGNPTQTGSMQDMVRCVEEAMRSMNAGGEHPEEFARQKEAAMMRCRGGAGGEHPNSMPGQQDQGEHQGNTQPLNQGMVAPFMGNQFMGNDAENRPTMPLQQEHFMGSEGSQMQQPYPYSGSGEQPSSFPQNSGWTQPQPEPQPQPIPQPTSRVPSGLEFFGAVLRYFFK